MTTDDKILRELQSIKRLLILQLMLQGANSESIGNALEIDPSAVRKMVPAGNLLRKRARSS